jgi:hypothetical protein
MDPEQFLAHEGAGQLGLHETYFPVFSRISHDHFAGEDLHGLFGKQVPEGPGLSDQNGLGRGVVFLEELGDQESPFRAEMKRGGVKVLPDPTGPIQGRRPPGIFFFPFLFPGGSAHGGRVGFETRIGFRKGFHRRLLFFKGNIGPLK